MTLSCTPRPKNERKLPIVFHHNGLITVSARLIAPGSRLVDTGGEFLRCLQGSKGGAACLRPRRPCQPLPKPHKVEGRCSRQMLQMRLGESNVARVPEATPSNTLRVGALDTCPRGILVMKYFGGLSLPRGLQRLILLALLES